MLEGWVVTPTVGTAVLVGVLVGSGVLVVGRVGVVDTAVLVFVGVVVNILLGVGVVSSVVGNGVLVGVPASGKGMMPTGVCETAVPVSLN